MAHRAAYALPTPLPPPDIRRLLSEGEFMPALALALCWLLLLAGCAPSAPDAVGGDTPRAGCAHRGGELCALGPQGRQNKR
jgi:hypothetical protein